jgi:hypothetical protein
MSHSRRRFLASALLLPSLSLRAPMRVWAASDSHGAAGPALFPRPDRIRYDAHCYTIGGKDTFIYSMECPYPRCSPQEWRDRFVKVRQAGFNTVSSYIFWNYHERQPDHFDFSELEAFLQMAHEFGFYVIVRPGPYVDAEFERGGFPAYVIAQRFPVRSMHPQSLRSSRHWYEHVLPVIRRYQITAGGPVILLQLENEMDFIDVPVAEQREYLRFLARLAWDAGIEVPLISNVSSAVHTRTDPDMARILDVCDFYPRWTFLTDTELPANYDSLTVREKVDLSDRTVLASLRRMRREEPEGPLSVGELGTGYFCRFGGKLPEDEEGADAAQLNALSKTLIEHGVTCLNYYIGWGGSNHEWAAKTITSTYDFAAPIREWGGLWDKYYDLKAMGGFVRLYGTALLRSEVLDQAARSTHPDMTVSERVNGDSAFLFVRANTDAEHHFRLSFRDPVTGTELEVPQRGQLTMGPRAMKALPVQVSISGRILHYTTAEVLGHGGGAGRSHLVIYDLPGSAVELALAADAAPKVEGETSYLSWIAARKSAVIGLRVEAYASYLLIDDALLIVVLPRALALRTWLLAFDPGATVGRFETPVVTDAYLLADSGGDTAHAWMDIDYLPGEHAITVLLPSRPAQCLIDGKPQDFSYEPSLRTCTARSTVPQATVRAMPLTEFEVALERMDSAAGNWIQSGGRVLEELGPIPYGYVKYRTRIRYRGESSAYLRAFTANPKKVFINGKYAPEASKPERFVEFAATEYFSSGDNTVEIAYELFGSTQWGETARMAELNGIDSLQLGTEAAAGALVDHWAIQLFPAATKGRELNAEFRYDQPRSMRVDGRGAVTEPLPVFAWCQTVFRLPALEAGWIVPWKLVFEARRDALIYLNDKFLARYATIGPQTDFYLPSAWLRGDARDNRLTIVLAYTDSLDAIQCVSVEPYGGYLARRVRVEYRW